MASITLHYFPFAGRGHPIRQALIAAGIPFTDNRIEFEEWGRTNGDQSLYPQGTLPVLEVDGKRIGDLVGILAYVGSVGNLLPSDPLLLGRAFEIGSFIEQIYTGPYAEANFTSTMRIEDQDLKKQQRSGPFVNTLRYYLGCVQRVVEESSRKEGFALGDKLSIADFTIANIISHMTGNDVDYVDGSFILKEFAPLVKIRQNVDSIPAVAEWLSKGNGY